MHCSSFVVVALLRGLPSAPVYICTLATNTGVGAFGTQVAKALENAKQQMVSFYSSENPVCLQDSNLKKKNRIDFLTMCDCHVEYDSSNQ